jgi:hypothetical protein
VVGEGLHVRLAPGRLLLLLGERGLGLGVGGMLIGHGAGTPRFGRRETAESALMTEDDVIGFVCRAPRRLIPHRSRPPDGATPPAAA